MNKTSRFSLFSLGFAVFALLLLPSCGLNGLTANPGSVIGTPVKEGTPIPDSTPAPSPPPPPKFNFSTSVHFKYLESSSSNSWPNWIGMNVEEFHKTSGTDQVNFAVDRYGRLIVSCSDCTQSWDYAGATIYFKEYPNCPITMSFYFKAKPGNLNQADISVALSSFNVTNNTIEREGGDYPNSLAFTECTSQATMVFEP